MNLRNFVEAVKNDELSNKAVMQKFTLACQNISLLDADSLRVFIKEGFFDKFVDLEADDVFGTIALTGNNVSAILSLSDITIQVPDNRTAHIQQVHLVIYHLLCDILK